MSPDQFRNRLLDISSRKQHWSIAHFNGPGATKDQLRIHYRQEYAVYVRDFGILLARILGKNPPWEARRHLAAVIYEEETGGLSLNHPHQELFLQLMFGLGFNRAEFREVELLGISRCYREWLDHVCQEENWLIGAANLTILVEGTSQDRDDVNRLPAAKTAAEIEELIRNHPLTVYHHVNPKCMDFIRVREMIEPRNRHIVYDLIVKEAIETQQQKLVLESLEQGLDWWCQYRDGIARACGLRKP